MAKSPDAPEERGSAGSSGGGEPVPPVPPERPDRPPVQPPSGDAIIVGPGQTYTFIQDAVDAAPDGATIAVLAGTYANNWTKVYKNLTFVALNGRVVLTSSGMIDNGKAIFVVQGDISIMGFDFTGAQVDDWNGAGIRYEGGNLACTDCRFYQNQNGILGGPPTPGEGTVRLDRCETHHNGAGDGQTHNLYINHVGHFLFMNSYSHEANVGHLLKSRAHRTTVQDSRLHGLNSTCSYALDFPNGGEVMVEHCEIQEGTNTDNPHMIMYGAEGNLRPVNMFTVKANVLVDDRGTHACIVNRTSETIQVINNQTWNIATLTDGPAYVSNNIQLGARPELDTTPP